MKGKINLWKQEKVREREREILKDRKKDRKNRLN